MANDVKPVIDMSKPPEGYEWLYAMIQRVEEMHEATVGEGSPVRQMQAKIERFGESLELLRKDFSKLSGDYSGLHKMTLEQKRLNEENWKNVNANYDLLRLELNNVKDRQNVMEGEIVDLRGRVDRLEQRKVG